MSWLFNDRAEVSTALRPCVELFGGDRLPGQVVGYRYGTELPVDRQAAHLLVKPDAEAVQSPHVLVRVRTQAVRKVVWQPRRSDRYTPSTLYLVDERQISFRALRWNAEGVTLLLNEGGTRSVGFSEIAELHLPRRDPWRAYQEMVAVLSPDCSARLMRVETSHGLVVTGTRERSQVRAAAHLLQPAWCLEPVGFAHRQLRWWRFFWPHEVPLSIIEPLRAEQRSPLEGVRAWQADQNVKLQPLRSGGKLYGGGFGMQAYTELEFELPAAGPRLSHSLVGMDELAFRSGCGRGRVHVNSTCGKAAVGRARCWSAPASVATTEIPAAPGSGAGTEDPDPGGRAPGRTAGRGRSVEHSLLRRTGWSRASSSTSTSSAPRSSPWCPETIPAWQGWTASTTGGGRLSVSYRWDVLDPADPRFQPDMVIQGGSVVLSRQVEIGPSQNFLCLVLGRAARAAGGLGRGARGRPAGGTIHRAGVGTAATRSPGSIRRRFSCRWPGIAARRSDRGGTSSRAKRAGRSSGATWKCCRSRTWPRGPLWKWSRPGPRAAETRLWCRSRSTRFSPRARTRASRRATDTYTIVAETSLAEISAFRLELLPDPRLAGNGPGRGGGMVFLSEFKVNGGAARPARAGGARDLDGRRHRLLCGEFRRPARSTASPRPAGCRSRASGRT